MHPAKSYTVPQARDVLDATRVWRRLRSRRGHEQKIIRRARCGRRGAERINEESDLGKHIKGNSDWQRNHGNG